MSKGCACGSSGLEAVFFAFSKEMATRTAQKRLYTAENTSMKEALRLIENKGWSLYKVSKDYNIPLRTLKHYTENIWRILRVEAWQKLENHL
jgi:hypothetical protein